MKKKWYKNQKIIIPMFIVLGLFIIIGTSYALWQITLQQTGTNVITTGCLKLTLIEETDAINLTNVTPTSDENGKKLTPYTFTIENTCTTDTNYVINLETTSTGDKILADNYVKAYLISNTDELFLDKLLAKHINEEKVITTATNAYKLYQGTLKNKEKKQFSLRIWLDEETEAIDEVMNATWQGKVTVTGNFIQNSSLAKIVELLSINHNGQIWKYRNSTTKIIFENTIHEIEGAVESFNIASDKTDNAEKIMAYVVANTDDASTHTIYIQGNGGVGANENSSYLFSDFEMLTSIEGLEYFDTSQVVNMYYMFFNCRRLTNLDVSHFDTSQVTTMEEMFGSCHSLTNLDLSSFNTSQVTTMMDMFSNCSRLTSLNLSSFDTSQVTDMYGMFNSCSSLTNLDLSSFDTGQVIDMSNMFNECRSLTSLDLSGFNTSQVTTMMGMFSNCRGLISLDLSSFDTSQVTTMEDIFFYCTSLTNLDVSHFDTSQVTTMEDMFSCCISLTSLDLSGFDTSKVTNMQSMFISCISLTNLDLSSFDTGQVTDMSFMFSSCGKLTTTINIMNPNTTSYSSMFSNAAINDGTSIKANYTTETSNLVDQMIATKSRNGNVEKGIEIAI